MSSKIIPGEIVFKLHDTFGFPFDLTADIAREQDLELDQAGFKKCMEEQIKNSKRLRRLISKYQENRDLVLMGGYVQGQDQDLDTALGLWPDILTFLQQEQSEGNSYESACTSLSQLVGHLA